MLHPVHSLISLHVLTDSLQSSCTGRTGTSSSRSPNTTSQNPQGSFPWFLHFFILATCLLVQYLLFAKSHGAKDHDPDIQGRLDFFKFNNYVFLHVRLRLRLALLIFHMDLYYSIIEKHPPMIFTSFFYDGITRSIDVRRSVIMSSDVSNMQPSSSVILQWSTAIKHIPSSTTSSMVSAMKTANNTDTTIVPQIKTYYVPETEKTVTVSETILAEMVMTSSLVCLVINWSFVTKSPHPSNGHPCTPAKLVNSARITHEPQSVGHKKNCKKVTVCFTVILVFAPRYDRAQSFTVGQWKHQACASWVLISSFKKNDATADDNWKVNFIPRHSSVLQIWSFASSQKSQPNFDTSPTRDPDSSARTWQRKITSKKNWHVRVLLHNSSSCKDQCKSGLLAWCANKHSMMFSTPGIHFHSTSCRTLQRCHLCWESRSDVLDTGKDLPTLRDTLDSFLSRRRNSLRHCNYTTSPLLPQLPAMRTRVQLLPIRLTHASRESRPTTQSTSTSTSNPTRPWHGKKLTPWTTPRHHFHVRLRKQHSWSPPHGRWSSEKNSSQQNIDYNHERWAAITKLYEQ